MGVPEEIRKVERPPNTVVVDNGRDGPNRYAVRCRKGVKYVPGGNPQPVNGQVIGHIHDGRFVPVDDGSGAGTAPDMLSYGSSALVRSEWNDILDDLYGVYSIEDAQRIVAIAALKTIRPGIRSKRISTHYSMSFISRFLPGLHLSANTVCDFYQRLGMDGAKRRRFYERRIERVSEDHHIVIDGTLKQDSSTVNSLSDFSYKSRTRGLKNISILYAYDIERFEPICAQVFPGNCPDESAYSEFIRTNGIKKGVIIADKGFPASMISKELEEFPGLHFLSPVKRNDSRITKHGLRDFEGVLEDTDGPVMYKKAELPRGRYMYAFRDARRASQEERTYLQNRAGRDDFDLSNYERKKMDFGVIVFESDLDMPPETAYKCYDDRWVLELVFRQYGSDEELTATGVQNDFSVIGAEFVNSISTVLTCRIMKRFRDTGLLKKRSYGDIMEDLNTCWRRADAPAQPSRGDGCWVHTLKYAHETMEALGLSQAPPAPAPKKRGRPRKNP